MGGDRLTHEFDETPQGGKMELTYDIFHICVFFFRVTYFLISLLADLHLVFGGQYIF